MWSTRFTSRMSSRNSAGRNNMKLHTKIRQTSSSRTICPRYRDINAVFSLYMLLCFLPNSHHFCYYMLTKQESQFAMRIISFLCHTKRTSAGDAHTRVRPVLSPVSGQQTGGSAGAYLPYFKYVQAALSAGRRQAPWMTTYNILHLMFYYNMVQSFSQHD